MPGRASGSRTLRYVGVGVALVAFVGTVVPGWEFGGAGEPVPLAFGAGCAVVAAGCTLYRRA